MSSEPHPATELEALTHGLRRALRRRAALGVRRVERAAGPERDAQAPPGPPSPAPAPPGGAAPALPPPPAPDRPLTKDEVRARAEAVRAVAARCPDLATLAQAVAGCTACGLCRTRIQTVFADGDGSAGVLFVGEAPGQQEDERGVPFVGPAGQLLSAIIEKGMGLPRATVLIANVLKCRPPGNRDPLPSEKAICTGWLDRQMELAGARVIVPLGRHAAGHVLGCDVPLGRLRGAVHERDGRKVVPTFHPAYLLRSPAMKKDCWQDIQLAMDALGLTPPPKKER
jgi:DNA polymerase